MKKINLIIIVGLLISIIFFYLIINRTNLDENKNNEQKTFRNVIVKEKSSKTNGKKPQKMNKLEVLEKKKNVITKYKNLLRKKISSDFPKGEIISDAVSKCYSTFFRREKKYIIPKGSVVSIVNYSMFYRSKHNTWQVLYNGEIYCIKKNKVKKKDTIMILQGQTIDADIWERFVLFPNGKFIEIAMMSIYYDDYVAEYFSGIGTYSKTGKQIELCNFELWLPGSSVFPANTECLKFTKKKRNWFRMDRNYPTFSLNEF